MPITPYSSSDLTRSKNNRQIYSGYRINLQASQLGIPGTPTNIKGPSRDIVQALREGPLYFTPTELTAILNNNSGSTAASGPPAPPPGPTPLIFSSNTGGTPLPLSFTIPIGYGYTQLEYVIIGGGGGGGNGGASGGMGGGSGGIIQDSVFIDGTGSMGVVTTISILLGSGGAAGSGNLAPSGADGTDTILSFNGNAYATAGGGGGGVGGQVGGGGVPGGVDATNNGQGGALPSAAFAAYGRGGNGADTGMATTGGAGYYSIYLT